jgi:hypothetical protein
MLVVQPTRFLNSCRPNPVRVHADAIMYGGCESIRAKASRTIGCTEGRSAHGSTELRCVSLTGYGQDSCQRRNELSSAEH